MLYQLVPVIESVLNIVACLSRQHHRRISWILQEVSRGSMQNQRTESESAILNRREPSRTGT